MPYAVTQKSALHPPIYKMHSCDCRSAAVTSQNLCAKLLGNFIRFG